MYMKFHLVTALLAGSALAAPKYPISANNIEKRGSRGVVKFPVVKKTSEITLANNPFARLKRDEVDTGLGNVKNWIYTVNITVGTPPTEIEVQLDTGSSDLWVYNSDSGAAEGTYYSTNSSSTYHYINSDFSAQYASGDPIPGDWVTDTIGIENYTIPNQKLAVCKKIVPKTDYGIMGVGMVEGEIPEQKYSNVPASLYEQGYVNRNAYSLYLDDVDSQSGSILFGGVDTERYSGLLYEIPVTLPLDLATNVTFGNTTFTALLDCGAPFIYLPPEVCEEIADIYSATVAPSGYMFVDEIPSESINFLLFGAPISIPGAQIVRPTTNPHGKYMIPIVSNEVTSGKNLLGDYFLRSAYVVYDLTNKVMAIGQATYMNKTNIIPIPADGPIPGSVLAPALQSSSDKSSGLVTGILDSLL